MLSVLEDISITYTYPPSIKYCNDYIDSSVNKVLLHHKLWSYKHDLILQPSSLCSPAEALFIDVWLKKSLKGVFSFFLGYTQG